MTESFLEWKKTFVSSQVNRNKFTTRHIIINLQNFKEKEGKDLKIPGRKTRLLSNLETNDN